MTTKMNKHHVEDQDSWEEHLTRNAFASSEKQQPNKATTARSSLALEQQPQIRGSRVLKKKKKHHHHHHYAGGDKSLDLARLEQEREAEFWQRQKETQEAEEEALQEASAARDERIHQLFQSSAIVQHRTTVHGLLIDAGSTGSRLHVYEWEPRVLFNEQDIEEAVSGNKLSFPGTDTRWTERLRPGLASFADRSDEELIPALAEYLAPLLDFAKAVLHSKQEHWGSFPIFLRATAGMRILPADQRARVMDAVRQLFAQNQTFCPFQFAPEQARVLSGEEEAIYDWAGVNFLMGDLISQSEGAGTVVNPTKTHGALDLGGGSTQISFYEPREDIMSNLFKMQIGQAKHWNVYAHSFLFYGMNEAIHRFQARLVADKTAQERLVDGVYNPCMPGGAKLEFRTNIHLTNATHMETWEYADDASPSHDGFFQAIIQNHEERGDPDQCLKLAKDLLHLEQNQWCDFAHQGDCSLAGVYQPHLPRTGSESFGEFLAFSNYHHVWKFLKLPDVATIAELEAATRKVCAFSHDEAREWASVKKFTDSDVDSYCFRSAYVFQLLHNGFGFHMNDTIRATNVVNGHKVGWALGAMLYEINALPWSYHHDQTIAAAPVHVPIVLADSHHLKHLIFWIIVGSLLISIVGVFAMRQRRKAKYASYEVVKDSAVEP